MLLRCQYYPEIYRFDAVPNQILVMFLYRNIKIHPTIHVEFQRTPNDQKEKKKKQNLQKKSKVGDLTPPDFKPYCKAAAIKTV